MKEFIFKGKVSDDGKTIIMEDPSRNIREKKFDPFELIPGVVLPGGVEVETQVGTIIYPSTRKADKGGPAQATPGGKKCCGPDDFGAWRHPDEKEHLYL